MPELPEVETVCQAIKPILEGASFKSIQLNRPNLRYPFPPHLEKNIACHSILKVHRRAKYLLLDFDHGLTLIMHLGMSGRIILEPLDIIGYKQGPHDHAILATSNNYKLIYRDPRRFGFFQLEPTDRLQSLNPFNKLGPEPLESFEIIASQFYNRLQLKSTSLKSALLDQRIIAGVGNIYASEALWQAKFSPFRLANTLTLEEATLLLRELQDVLKRAIAAGGSTLRDHALPNKEIGYFQHQFKAYKRENQPCYHCKTTLITKLNQHGRATYCCQYCQRCQVAT